MEAVSNGLGGWYDWSQGAAAKRGFGAVNGPAINPYELLFYVDSELILRTGDTSGRIVSAGYRKDMISLSGSDAQQLARLLSKTDQAVMVVVDPALTGGRFNLVFKRKDLSHFASIIAFYDALAGKPECSEAIPHKHHPHPKAMAM